MTETIEERVGRLPKWAQEYIQGLQAEVAFWKKIHEQISLGSASNISWRLAHGEPAHGIPEDATVTFITTAGYIDARVKNGFLALCHSHHMVFYPLAHNAINIV